MLRAALAALPVIAVAACGQVADSASRAQDSAPAGAPSETATPKGSWIVDGAASRVSFVSVKAAEVAEVHHFTGVSGDVTDDGAAVIAIDLDTVETLVEIRNERMREIFFETGEHPKAVVSAALDLAQFEELKPGQRLKTALEATLSLHGQDTPVTAEVFVTRAGADRVLVETVDPLVVSVFDFGLEGGLAQLQEIAGLPSITPAVPVTFSIALGRAPA